MMQVLGEDDGVIEHRVLGAVKD